jgi:peroxiredoxin
LLPIRAEKKRSPRPPTEPFAERGRAVLSVARRLPREGTGLNRTSAEGQVMTIQVGDKVPSVTLKYMGPDGVKEISSDEFFRGKKVALFAVPGAFTPTCSARHLPGFVERAADIKRKGIDEIACIAVNDAFVMGAWGKEHKTDGKVTMLADGSGDFARAVGLELDARKMGLGVRSQRYSMVVDNGVVKAINIEKPGQFEVSSAEAMLQGL